MRDSGFSTSDFIIAEFHKFGINLRKIDDEHISISFNETTSMVDLDEVIEIFADLMDKRDEGDYISSTFYEDKNYEGLPEELSRKSSFMT